jgi:FAD/FMN-containing dehydrogenase
MALKEDLIAVVGADYVSDDPETLERYARDLSLVQPRRPSYVTRPASTEQVQQIVKYANDNRIPVTPRSSGIGYYGAGIPNQGGIIIDLSRMDKIREIDPRNKKVKVEAGVTWAKLQEALAKEGMMVCNPLLPHRDKSVVTSALEREPILVPKTEYSDQILSQELVMASGELFWTGTALGKAMKDQCFPDAFVPGARLWQGAQGTLGITTWANLKAEFLPVKDKVFFIAFDRIEDIAEPVYRIERRMLGYECFVLNRLNLAAILAGDSDQEFETLKAKLPPWTVILCLSALDFLPEEKIAYEEEALKEIASELKFSPADTVAGIPGLDSRVLQLLRKPWAGESYWKLRHQGGSSDIFFHTTLDRAAEFNEAIAGVAVEYGYDAGDIGVYLQPLDRARACFTQFGLHYHPENESEVSRVKDLYLAASEVVIKMGGFFTTPYGPWADLVYSRTTGYTATLKIVKDAYDPNHILNPGKLCF